MRRYCYTLDLKNDPALIAEYRKHHEHVWPEVEAKYRACGIETIEIYLLGTRMFLIMEVNDLFSFEKKAALDRDDPKIREWEQLMDRFQDVSSQANGKKWMQMELIYKMQ